ncbi:MAG: class I SAM-dependent methyltransferase, partial [Flavobacteriaceae bacterium]|nr:class I SAM-dependent methyltransferase [Flavobacteriaceae bacterium]
TFDVIYADPARRHSSKGKVFLLEDCQPDIIGNFDFIFERCHQFLLKTSPMLDISSGLQDLRWVREIHVVAVDNDVKELLWLMEKQYAGEIKIVTQNFTKETVQPFHFMWGQTIEPTYSLPKRYLYEPNAALMKAGHFGELSQKLNVDKLHQHSHLFTADHLVDMLGRTFTIEAIIPYQKRNMAPFKNTKANVTVRNFPESVATLRKKWRIKDGGQVYLFFTKDKNESLIVLRCSKMDHQP